MSYKSFKFELILNKKQIRDIRKNFGCTRFISNCALAWYIKNKEKSHQLRFDSRNALIALDEWKIEYPWLLNYENQIIKEAIRDLETAFKHYYARRLNHPKFKKKEI